MPSLEGATGARRRVELVGEPAHFGCDGVWFPAPPVVLRTLVDRHHDPLKKLLRIVGRG